MHSVAIVSPGLLPIPPIIGGSVETVIQKMATVAKSRYAIDIYGPAHRLLPAIQTIDNINYYRFSARPYNEYFKAVRKHITGLKKYHIIQVENRPLFIPTTKAFNPAAKFICSLHSLDHIDRKLISPQLTDRIFSQCDKILVYSEFMQKKLGSMFPSAAHKINFIHLATDPGRFKPRWEPDVQNKIRQLRKKLGIRERDKVVLFAGRVIPKKGVHILLKTMEELVKKVSNVCLVVMGSSWFGNQVPTAYIKELRQQGNKLGKKLIFTNYVYPDKVPYYFAMADVFVCPSQWDEPFGLVNVEAMATGVPVVASARGGIPEIISDGENGFLVNNESSPAAFVQPLLKILGSPALGRSLGVNGRKKVEAYFNWERAGRDLIKLWEETIVT